MARSRFLSRLLPFSPSATPLQAATYLLGIALFSISFLVFLNSAISFVITDLLGVKTGVGDIVGTLGFVDELVALVACPVWGLVSDRLGVRWVAVIGYAIIAVSLFGFVQARDVYPSLVLARIGFALGATAAATMVTAILPVLTGGGGAGEEGEDEEGEGEQRERDRDALSVRSARASSGTGTGSESVSENESSRPKSNHNPRSSLALSLESDATITPERFTTIERNLRSSDGSEDSSDAYGSVEGRSGRPSALAGYVGLFTGCGALVALVLFLPLPAQFSKKDGVTPAEAITHSFYVVGSVALVVAIFVFFGLRGLKGEEGKGWRMLLGLRLPLDARIAYDHNADAASSSSSSQQTATGRTQGGPLPYHRLLLSSLRLGATDPHIALGYLGGFVARASTVAISLFIPLYINAFFIGNGFCRGSPNDPSPELKKECRAAYVLASILTGVAQLAALLCAPLFGYISSRTQRGRGRGIGVDKPLVVAALFGVAGYLAFPHLASPEYHDVNGRGGSPAVFLIMVLIGISQIGAIVCSLGSLGRGVLATEGFAASTSSLSSSLRTEEDEDEGRGRARETDALLTTAEVESGGASGAPISRVHLKGSIAGVYSWCGGAAILLLTKLGGYLFDVAAPGAPFYMMAAFNAALLVASLGIGLGGLGWRGGEGREGQRL
ncbi:uncharacterized protein GGS25DRAFT_529373 [Hypoxylon fragiforme]|uniref:uncharacterized protein n=1 Tax=Hypoxylon fragiforme TaxID=63214 RepID=UPI0020C61313|nr:uncharacterized protein GGS25DRAFT_529373 [Hypoxylon fragiforme]KAI2612833.1 hypothetical protein GGS25DRAFT_529373 [Hypoxylon fragiforme]